MRIKQTARENNRQKKPGPRFRRLLRFAALLVLVTAAGFISPLSAKAAESLTVNAGYEGLPTVEKATYSVSQLLSLGLMEGGSLFTGLNSANQLVYCTVSEGVDLQDLLYTAGVDMESVSSCTFGEPGGYRGGVKYSAGLLFGRAFAYPEACLYYDFGFTDAAKAAVSAASQYVPTMLAYADNYHEITTKEPYNADLYPSTSGSSFRLLVGQTSPDEVVTNTWIQNVNMVNAYYAGTPVIDCADPEPLEEGQTAVLTPEVTSLEPEISAQVQERLTFSSENIKVATVDAAGTVTALKEGEANIVIAFHRESAAEPEITKTVHVSVGKAKEEEPENPDGTGGGSGGGSGTGDGAGTGDGTGSGSEGDGSGSGGTGTGSGTGTEEAGGKGKDTSGSGNGEEEGGSGILQNTANNQSAEAAPSLLASADSARYEAAALLENNREALKEENEEETREESTEEQSTSPTLLVRKLTLAGTGEGQSGSAGGEEGMTGGGGTQEEELQVPQETNKSGFSLLVAGLAAVFFAGGGAVEYLFYRKSF